MTKNYSFMGAFIWGGMIFQGLLLLLNQLHFQETSQAVIQWIAAQGLWSGLIFILVYILATILFVPGLLLTLGAGFLFGVVWGSIYVSIASTLGATLAFLIGRYLARNWVEKRIQTHQKFQAIDQAVAVDGWKIVGLTRLSPLFPFNLLNYAFGITKVSLMDYFLASWLGMLPATIMYVYLGSLVKDFSDLGNKNQPITMAEWIVRGVGFLATVIVTIYVTQIAQKSLKSIEN